MNSIGMNAAFICMTVYNNTDVKGLGDWDHIWQKELGGMPEFDTCKLITRWFIINHLPRQSEPYKIDVDTFRFPPNNSSGIYFSIRKLSDPYFYGSDMNVIAKRDSSDPFSSCERYGHLIYH